MSASNHLNPSEYHGRTNYELNQPGTGLFATGGWWSTSAWRGYGSAPLPTPEYGCLERYERGTGWERIASGSGEAMLAVARLYGYDERDFLDSVQRYSDPDTWGGYALLRLDWVPREVKRMPSGDEHDASDWARWGCDEDGHATLRTAS